MVPHPSSQKISGIVYKTVFPSSLEWGHHPHQRKDSWSSVMRLIRYISQ